ncbi:hypothetical protein RE6C_03562 [Rhodopirellula europaea 6C]|uniref:Uncharacterized protein n=1 Tax=Rhodopirellula europaea 6C TaxID=1263867 RepID=M2ASJ3_9BACT|nr:hypothetical protein RE6C_03562 [Rhodopirellula europaea 6C]
MVAHSSRIVFVRFGISNTDLASESKTPRSGGALRSEDGRWACV